MKSIQLTRGRIALVDDEDFEWLLSYKWCFDGQYAATRFNNFKIRMHRLIMGNPETQVDHKNLNKLDCQKANLRLASNAQNCCNKGMQPSNTSGYKGVHWNKNAHKWQAQIKVRGIRYHLGYFANIEDAKIAYKTAVNIYHGEFARTEVLHV